MVAFSPTGLTSPQTAELSYSRHPSAATMRSFGDAVEAAVAPLALLLLVVATCSRGRGRVCASHVDPRRRYRRGWRGRRVLRGIAAGGSGPWDVMSSPSPGPGAPSSIQADHDAALVHPHPALKTSGRRKNRRDVVGRAIATGSFKGRSLVIFRSRKTTCDWLARLVRRALEHQRRRRPVRDVDGAWREPLRVDGDGGSPTCARSHAAVARGAARARHRRRRAVLAARAHKREAPGDGEGKRDGRPMSYHHQPQRES